MAKIHGRLVQVDNRPTITVEDPETGETTTRERTDHEMREIDWNPWGEHPNGGEIFLGTPNADPLEGATEIKGGWFTTDEIARDLPDVADVVLEATWKEPETDENGNEVEVLKRGKKGPAKSRGKIPAAHQNNLPPRGAVWMGHVER